MNLAKVFRPLASSARAPAAAALSRRTWHAPSRLQHTASSEYAHLTEKSTKLIDLEHKYCAHNYHPLPVVLERGYQTRVWDVEGKEYLDFIAAYSALNQGHCHPHIIAAMSTQAAKLTLSSRAVHNNILAPFLQRLCSTFGYDRALPMNTGVEGGETAVKLARRWGYDVKGISPDHARVVFARNNFWGRSIAAVSSSSDWASRNGFGPFVPGFDMIDYDDLDALEAHAKNPDTCAFMVEPIQGEAGIVVPSAGFLAKAHDICRKHNVLLIADEVQTGLGRTGRMLASEHDGVKPDMVVLGKALSGGMYPVSVVLGSDEVLGLLRPGEHGSTYGGSAMACAVGMAALDVLEDEALCENAERMGGMMRDLLNAGRKFPGEILQAVRGKGLMNGLVIKDVLGGERTAWQVCLEMARNGVLAKPTHARFIRLTPPLVIREEEVKQACIVIRDALRAVSATASPEGTAVIASQ